MPIRFLALVGLWLLLSTSCGGSDQGSGEPVPVEEFPSRFATEWCGMLQRCCQASGGTSEGSCEADALARNTRIGNEAAADGAIWDAVVAGRCLDAIARADCTSVDAMALRELLDSCDDTWTGVVPPGGTCQTYASCAEPQVTGGATAGASCVNSTCVQFVRQPPGAACSGTTLTCDPFLATCTAGTCVAFPSAGESCSGSCAIGARCIGGTCMPLLATGQACSLDGECVSDKCSGGQCASTFVADGEYCALP